MADSNKIKYGIKNVFYAVATIAANGSATYATPVALPGAVSLSMDPQGEMEPFYADNIQYYVSVLNDGYEGNLELAKVPDSFLTDVLGYVADANGVLYENANAPAVHFALLFQFEGDVHARRGVLYNCTATRPTVGGSTKEAQISPETQTIPIRATSVYNASVDKDVVKASVTPSEATQYNAWTTTVYQPVASGG